jgi:hypothetical protein
MPDNLRLKAFTACWLLSCGPAEQTTQHCGAGAGAPCATQPQPNVAGAPVDAGEASRVVGGVAGQGSLIGSTSGHAAVGVGAREVDLNVHVEDAKKLTLTLVTLACAGDCADIEAVASGGNPPYTYAWEDGSKDAKRHVCLDSSKSLRISATDTAIVAAEFGYVAHTASADVQATVMACSDAGVPPPMTTGCMQPTASATCKLASGAMLPEDITVMLIDQQQWFAGGADLPAGRYRLTYLDGCFCYGVPVATLGWTVHASKAAGFGCFLIGANGMTLMPTPGTDGFTVDAGSFETYAKCVAANCGQAPLDFDFAGGKLGVARNGGTALAEFDDSDGSDMGGRGPTFRLSRLDPCP